MRVTKEVKKVVIPYNHHIPFLGVSGPIDNPITLETKVIFDILSRKIPVYEYMLDGSKVKLNLVNYNKKFSSLSSYELIYDNVKKSNNNNVITLSDERVKSSSVEEILRRSTLPPEEKKEVIKEEPKKDPISVINVLPDKPKKNYIHDKHKPVIEEEQLDTK